MKWFKHDADAFLSEGVDALIDAEGFAGYGRWNRVLEIVAFKMDDTNRCHAEYSIQKWCRLLGLKQKKLISFLELTENQLKTKVVYSENIIRIEIPNLLKKRDNYTKHLQVPKKPLVSIDKDKEVDREVEKKKTIKKKDVWILPEGVKPEVWQEYEDHRKTTKKKLTDAARTKNANVLLSNLSDQQEIVDTAIKSGWTGLFPFKKGKVGNIKGSLVSLTKKDYSEGVGENGELL
ncbi:hypothetical protein KAR91_29880 [Candidatus Pacearchaeota archaeon]|nr:hypothetical protein [Candidatus Pacearchaeota archaeon]